MFSVLGMCRWTGYSFHHSCSRAGYRLLQKCSQKGILFSNFCSQTGLQCIFLILCSQTGCGFLQFCSQTGVFKLRKMLPDRVKITAPQRHTPVHIRTKCPPPPGLKSGNCKIVQRIFERPLCRANFDYTIMTIVCPHSVISPGAANSTRSNYLVRRRASAAPQAPRGNPSII